MIREQVLPVSWRNQECVHQVPAYPCIHRCFGGIRKREHESFVEHSNAYFINESLLGAHKLEKEIYEERAGWSFVTGKCARSVATPYLTVSPVRGSSTTIGSSCLAPYVDQTFTTVACGTPVASRSEAGCSCHERSDADY